jgi:hypothetical protein
MRGLKLSFSRHNHATIASKNGIYQRKIQLHQYNVAA